MSLPEDQTVSVFQSQTRGECAELRLVLAAMGINATIGQGKQDGQARTEATQQGKGYWRLEVSPRDLAQAETEIESYWLERSVETPAAIKRTPIYQGARWGVIFYIGFLVSIALLSTVNAYQWRWAAVGAMRAGEVMTGRFWQTATALTLHADLNHLASNLLFGSLFGFLAGRVLGGGVAWLAIVSAGSLGNLINAAFRQPEHVSIGASTAVFAALGIIVSHALYPRTGNHLGTSTPPSANTRAGVLKRYSPLIAGVVMLAFLGLEGERTDVLAHVAGFFAGLLTGALGGFVPRGWLANTSIQRVLGSLAIAIIVVSWAIAIAAS